MAKLVYNYITSNTSSWLNMVLKLLCRKLMSFLFSFRCVSILHFLSSHGNCVSSLKLWQQETELNSNL